MPIMYLFSIFLSIKKNILHIYDPYYIQSFKWTKRPARQHVHRKQTVPSGLVTKVPDHLWSENCQTHTKHSPPHEDPVQVLSFEFHTFLGVYLCAFTLLLLFLTFKLCFSLSQHVLRTAQQVFTFLGQRMPLTWGKLAAKTVLWRAHVWEKSIFRDTQFQRNLVSIAQTTMV